MTDYCEDTLWQQMKKTGFLANRPILFLSVTDSTNLTAMNLIKQKTASSLPAVVVADSQSHGRGRLGRSFLSFKGTGLYFSVIRRLSLAAVDFPKITLAAAVAVCRAIYKITGLTAKIKWPNDIFLNNKKCGGILTETQSISGNRSPLIILGVGLNVNTPLLAFSQELRPHVTTLKEVSGLIYKRGELLKAILEQLDAVFDRLTSKEFPAILAEYRQLDITYGVSLVWVTPTGRRVTGVSLGPDEHGALRIRDAKGDLHEVVSGDINLAKS